MPSPGWSAQGLLRECAAAPSSGGRPRVPLEIDPGRRHVLGVALGPGAVAVARLNLAGVTEGDPVRRQVAHPAELIAAAAQLLTASLTPGTLAIGLTVTGFVDNETREIIFSGATRGLARVSLEPLFAAAGATAVVLENDMSALAARWYLTRQADHGQDVLLSLVADTSLGASMLIDGKPNRGCAIAGNELGYSRFDVIAPGEKDGRREEILERICGTAYLQERTGLPGTLAEAITALRDGDASSMDHAVAPSAHHAVAPSVDYAGASSAHHAARPTQDDKAFASPGDATTSAPGDAAPGVVVGEIVRYLALGLSNACNLVRPDRLVLVSPFTRSRPFAERLQRDLRDRLLPPIAERMELQLWDQPADRPAENAGWLALASIYLDGWNLDIQQPLADAPLTEVPITNAPITNAPITSAPITDSPQLDPL